MDKRDAQPDLFAHWPEAEWTDRERAVWKCIQPRHGRENAIGARQIAAATGIGSPNDGRTVRDIVKHLIEYHRLPIASTCAPPYGYYRPWGAQEVDECYKWLVGLALSILRHASVFKRSSNLKELLGQLELEVGIQTEEP